MPRTDFNPFQAAALRLPKALQPGITELIQRKTGLDVEDSPFPRAIDFWFLSACVAIADGAAQQTGEGAKGWKFNEGTVLRDSRTRIELMELAAIGILGDTEVVKTPEAIVSLFNDCAALGAPVLLKTVASGTDTPLRNLIKDLAKRAKA